MESDERFFNFPIGLFAGAFDNIRETMDNIMNYAGYVHASALEFGDETERMKAAGNFFGITYGDNKRSYHEGEQLINSLPPNLPMTGINTDVCFDFYKNHKSMDQIAVLLAFSAIKSIIGSKAYYKTNIGQIGVRMAGMVSIKDIDKVSEQVNQFTTRRKFDKIKFELQTNWKVNFYSYYTRGFYVSFDDKFSLEKLVLEAEKNRKSNKERELQSRQKEARVNALKIINCKK
jgi:hypothetical protein